MSVTASPGPADGQHREPRPHGAGHGPAGHRAVAGDRAGRPDHPAARPALDPRPGRRTARGAADRRRRHPGRRGAGRAAGHAVRPRCGRGGDRHRDLGVRRQRPAVPRHRSGPDVVARQGFPARARPVRADPELRAARLHGQPGDERRRHDLAVRAVRWPAAAAVGRTAAGGHGADGHLLAAAHRAGLALLRPDAARRPLLPARACPSRTARCASGSPTCSARSPRPWSAPRPSGRTPSSGAPRSGWTARSRPIAGPRSGPRPESPSPSARGS